MINDILLNIMSYSNYLRHTLKLNVSFCDALGHFEQYMHFLMPFNIHENALCRCIKTNNKCLMKCVAKQRKVYERSTQGAFYGMCWAGVEEFVFPIANDEQVLAFVSVSGYRNNALEAQKRLKFLSTQYGFDYSMLISKYEHELKSRRPNMDFLHSIINPLCNMFSLLYVKTTNQDIDTSSPGAYNQILNYICYNYGNDITLESIAESCNYSTSYIRHLFKKKSNTTISQYLTSLRIKRAKELLSNADYNIRDIAAEVGYNDPNYFTNVFHKKTGLSPSAFRRKTINKKAPTIVDTF